MEQTFIMIKPNGVQRGLAGEIISRFKKKGFTLRGLKLIIIDKPVAEKHYADVSAKPFFNGLVEFVISGSVMAIWEEKGITMTGRKIMGATNPVEFDPKTICSNFATDISQNVIHGSDFVESAGKEIAVVL